MSGLVISSTDQSDLQLFIDLANRIGLKIKSLSTEEMKKFDFSGKKVGVFFYRFKLDCATHR